jgi:hypothetical protein
MKLTKSVAVLILILLAIGCQNQIENIPPGFVGKLLTPTGWKKGILEAGQVDIGVLDWDHRGNQLILCEATSVTVKESFAKAEGENGEDHRIITADKIPLAVDIYVQVAVPEDEQMRDSIFAQVTPNPVANSTRVSMIKLTHVYIQFAQMMIRGKTREIFGKYKSYNEVMNNYAQISTEVSGMIALTFKEAKVPLALIAGQLSNVKPDKTVWDSENLRAAAIAQADAIKLVGDAIRRNPGYIQKYSWDVIGQIAGKQNLTIIVTDGRTPTVLPVR